MFLGRDDAVDDRLSFADHVKYAKTTLDRAGGYMADKDLVLADYLRNGIRLMQAEKNDADSA